MASATSGASAMLIFVNFVRIFSLRGSFAPPGSDGCFLRSREIGPQARDSNATGRMDDRAPYRRRARTLEELVGDLPLPEPTAVEAPRRSEPRVVDSGSPRKAALKRIVKARRIDGRNRGPRPHEF